MTSLHTIIPQEYIKQSEKLQKTECDNCWCDNYDHISNIRECKYGLKCSRRISAPSIADVINNAEILFWKEEIPFHSTINTDSVYHEKWKLIGIFIIEMCQQDKSIEEISQYIIDNIK